MVKILPLKFCGFQPEPVEQFKAAFQLSNAGVPEKNMYTMKKIRSINIDPLFDPISLLSDSPYFKIDLAGTVYCT